MSLRTALRSWLGVSAAVVPEPKREPLKVSSTALAQAGREATRVDPFALPKPPPGVLPEGGTGMAADGALIGYNAWAVQDAIWGEGLQFMGYQYLAELTQRPEYRRISETIAMEMTRKWITFVDIGADEDTREVKGPLVEAIEKTAKQAKEAKIKKIEQAFERFGVRDAFRVAAEQDGFFGRSHIFIDLGDLDRDNLAAPLIINKRKIPKNGLKRLQNVEPMWVYPAAYNSSDPLRPDYFEPQAWFVMAQTVASSRLLTFVSREVPDILKPAYSFGGLSMSQMAKPYVDNWLQTRQSVNDFIHSFSVMVLKTNMDAVLQGGEATGVIARAQLFNQTRDNRGVMMIDKETEDFANVSASMSELSMLQAQAQEHMAAVSGIPLTILLGVTPSGLNASSDGEIRTFYGWIEDQQENIFRVPLQKVLEIVQLSEFGEIDENIGFEFTPLWTPSAVEEADIADKKSQTAERYINAGVLDPVDVRGVLVRDKDSPYVGLDDDEVPEEPAAVDPGLFEGVE